MNHLPPIIENPDMPEGAIAFVQDGEVVGSIVNIGKVAIEGEVVKAINYRDITDITDNFIHISEVAHWHEEVFADAVLATANSAIDQMMTVSSSTAGRNGWFRDRFVGDFPVMPEIPAKVWDAHRTLDPTSIDKATPAIKFDAMPSARPPIFAEPYRPTFWQRMHGYTANPATCSHHHTRFRTRWICADCGDDL